MLQKVVVTLDRLSVHTLWRCVHTLEQVELDAQQKGTRTQTRMLVRLYEEERYMGTPEMLPRHKTAKCTRKGERTQTKMLVHLYEEERCMGTPEMLPRHKITEHTTRRGRCREDFQQWCENLILKTYEIKCQSYKTIIENILILSKFNILVQKMKILKSFRMHFTT